MNGQPMAFSNVLNFLENYELLIEKEGAGMNKEQVETAVNLGKQDCSLCTSEDRKRQKQAGCRC